MEEEGALSASCSTFEKSSENRCVFSGSAAGGGVVLFFGVASITKLSSKPSPRVAVPFSLGLMSADWCASSSLASSVAARGASSSLSKGTVSAILRKNKTSVTLWQLTG